MVLPHPLRWPPFPKLSGLAPRGGGKRNFEATEKLHVQYPPPTNERETNPTLALHCRTCKCLLGRQRSSPALSSTPSDRSVPGCCISMAHHLKPAVVFLAHSSQASVAAPPVPLWPRVACSPDLLRDWNRDDALRTWSLVSSFSSYALHTPRCCLESSLLVIMYEYDMRAKVASGVSGVRPGNPATSKVSCTNWYLTLCGTVLSRLPDPTGPARRDRLAAATAPRHRRRLSNERHHGKTLF